MHCKQVLLVYNTVVNRFNDYSIEELLIKDHRNLFIILYNEKRKQYLYIKNL